MRQMRGLKTINKDVARSRKGCERVIKPQQASHQKKPPTKPHAFGVLGA